MTRKFLISNLILVILPAVCHSKQQANSSVLIKMPVRKWLSHAFWNDKKQVVYTFEALLKIFLEHNSKLDSSKPKYPDKDICAKLPFVFAHCTASGFFTENRFKDFSQYSQMETWMRELRSESVQGETKAEYLCMAAHYLYMHGEEKTAIELCKKSIALDKSFPESYKNIAWAYSKLSTNSKDIRDVKSNAKLSIKNILIFDSMRPGRLNTRYCLFHAYRYLEDYDAALLNVEKIIEYYKKNGPKDKIKQIELWRKDVLEKKSKNK